MEKDWAAAYKLGEDARRCHVDIYRIIQTIGRHFDVQSVVVYDCGPADGSTPTNAAIHENLKKHPLVRVHVEPGWRPLRRKAKRLDNRIGKDMLMAASRSRAADFVLVSGDEDIVPSIQGAQELGVRVTVACSLFLHGAKELRLLADQVIDIDHEANVLLETEAPQLWR
jgi:uncharacterized LabA/DUF88 family protein